MKDTQGRGEKEKSAVKRAGCPRDRPSGTVEQGFRGTIRALGGARLSVLTEGP